MRAAIINHKNLKCNATLNKKLSVIVFVVVVVIVVDVVVIIVVVVVVVAFRNA